MTSRIDEAEESKENIQSAIKEKEDKWKQITADIDKNEQTLIKLGEDLINSAEREPNDETLSQNYEKLLELEKKREEKLKMDSANSDETKVN